MSMPYVDGLGYVLDDQTYDAAVRLLSRSVERVDVLRLFGAVDCLTDSWEHFQVVMVAALEVNRLWQGMVEGA